MGDQGSSAPAKPWSLQDVRNNAANWSLQGDKQLLHILENMHEELLAKAEKTTAGMNALVESLDVTSLKLKNVNNRFMGLSSTQFVESRVQEDDVEIIKKPESEASPLIIEPSQKEMQKKHDDEKLKEKEKIMACVRDSLQVIQGMCERLDISPDSDTDSETDTNERQSVILRPIDLYANTPLPYIIGSKKWKEKWHIGLEDGSSSSDSEEEVAGRTVKGKGDDQRVEEYSSSEDEDTGSRARDIAQKKTQMSLPLAHAHNNASLSSSSNSWNAENSSQNENNPALEPKHTHDDPLSQETRKPQTPIVGASDFAAELARKLSGNPGSTPLPTNRENPKTTDNTVHKNISTKKTSYDPGLRSKPNTRVTGNIFMDEPPPLEDQDSFNDSKIEDPIFGNVSDEDDFLFSNEKPKNKSMFDTSAGIFPKSSSTKVGGLFDDIPDDSDDMFNDSLSSSKPEKKESPLNSTKNTSKSLFADDESNNGRNDNSKFKNTKSNKTNDSFVPKSNKDSKVASANKGLLNDADDRDVVDDFGVKRSTVKKSKGLFDDDFDDENDDFSFIKKDIAPKVAPKDGKDKRNSIFDDFEDDSGLFGDATNKSVKKDAGIVSVVKNDSKITNPPKKKSSLFDDDDDNDLFGILKKENTEQKGKVVQKKVPEKNKSLFNEDSDSDGGDLFSSLRSSKKLVTKKEVTKKEEPVTSKEESPIPDVEKEDVFAAIPAPKKPAGGVSMFGNNSEVLAASLKSRIRKPSASSASDREETVEKEGARKEQETTSDKTVENNVERNEKNIRSELVEDVKKSEEENVAKGKPEGAKKVDISKKNIATSPKNVESNDKVIVNEVISTKDRDGVTKEQGNKAKDADDKRLENEKLGTNRDKIIQDNSKGMKNYIVGSEVNDVKDKVDRQSHFMGSGGLFDDVPPPLDEDPPPFDEMPPPLDDFTSTKKPTDPLFDDFDNFSDEAYSNPPVIKPKPQIKSNFGSSGLFDKPPTDVKPKKPSTVSLFSDEPPDFDDVPPDDDRSSSETKKDDLFDDYPYYKTVNFVKSDGKISDNDSASDSVTKNDGDSLFQSESEKKNSRVNEKTETILKETKESVDECEKRVENAFFEKESVKPPIAKSKPGISTSKPLIKQEIKKENIGGIGKDVDDRNKVVATKKVDDDIKKVDATKKVDDEIKINVEKMFSSKSSSEVSKLVASMNKGSFDDEKSASEGKESETKSPTKVIGKLQSNLNINVRALMPGSAPRLVKAVSEEISKKREENEERRASSSDSDFGASEPKSSQSIMEEKLTILPQTLTKTDSTTKNEGVYKVPESVSFDEGPTSLDSILSNSASKDKVRIQVKRRPSSRKARHEAIRKSTIDITTGDLKDSEDFDEFTTSLPTSPVEKQSKSVKVEEKEEKTIKVEEKGVRPVKKEVKVEQDKGKNMQKQASAVLEQEKVKSDHAKVIEPDFGESSIQTIGTVYNKDAKSKSTESKSSADSRSDKTKKDDIFDIFRNDAEDSYQDLFPKMKKPKAKTEPAKEKVKEGASKKADELFANSDQSESIISKQKDVGADLFGDLEKTDLFRSIEKTKETSKGAVKKSVKKSSNLFSDSDDETNLFTPQAKTKDLFNSSKEKTDLFVSDKGVDLFAGNVENKLKASDIFTLKKDNDASVGVAKMKTNPSNLFGNEDEGDLFGRKDTIKSDQNDLGLFSSNKSKEKSIHKSDKIIEKKERETKKTKSLFGEIDEDEDDLFFRPKKSQLGSGWNKNVAEGTSKGGLFGDDNDDFDIFKPKKVDKSVAGQMTKSSSSSMSKNTNPVALSSAEVATQDPLSAFLDD